MTRRTEVLLRKAMDTLSVLLLLGGIGLAVWVYAGPQRTRDLEIELPQNSKAEPRVETDPKIKNLGGVKMSKTVTAKVEMPVKPPAPDLATLIRVKGIMAYGDPKDNEAIIETIRINQTKTYRVGETVPEANAVVTSINKDNKVVEFTYDGKTTRLEMKSHDRAEYRPVATPGEKPDAIAAGQGK
jgi:type II secretory pathway component PulC